MDRNKTIELSRLATLNRVPLDKALEVITDYCLENGKLDKDIIVFKEYLMKNIILLNYCLDQALDYFEKKFKIFKLWSIPNPSIKGECRTVLQIF